VFASEIKSLLQHPAVPRVPNDQTIFDYLALGVSDHTDQTFFADIFALPPSHFLIIDIAARQLSKHRWWQATINPNIEMPFNGGQDQVYGEFAALLQDSIRLRLRSDVPVGSCLSGGLDSSSVVCLANKLLLNEQVIPSYLVGEHQKTFTARNQETEIDEYSYSHQIIQKTGAEENLVFPRGETLWQEIENFVWHMDEPVDSTSQYPQWNVMRLARQRGVTVLLDGQGGDETLAGYYAYYPAYLSQLKQQQGLLPAIQAGWDICRVGGAPVANMLWLNGSQQLPWRLQQIAKFIRPHHAAPGTGGSGLTSWQLSSQFMERFKEREWQPFSGVDSDGLVGILYRDLTSTNLPKLLRYEDRNSMAFSLETRLPFLDFRLVEKVFSLPLNYRINNGWSKWILRRSMQDVLPPEICWRRSKLGFPTPEKNWLLQGSSYLRHLLEKHDTEQLANYIQPGVLHQIRQQSNVDLAATPGLWRITNLILWLDLFFNRNLRDVSTTVSQSVLASSRPNEMVPTQVA
jgi:asparagine synthase (glutamine-hydrolysing)